MYTPKYLYKYETLNIYSIYDARLTEKTVSSYTMFMVEQTLFSSETL